MLCYSRMAICIRLTCDNEINGPIDNELHVVQFYLILYNHSFFTELSTDIQTGRTAMIRLIISCLTKHTSCNATQCNTLNMHEYMRVFMANLCKLVIKENCICVEHRNRNYICIILHP